MSTPSSEQPDRPDQSSEHQPQQPGPYQPPAYGSPYGQQPGGSPSASSPGSASPGYGYDPYGGYGQQQPPNEQPPNQGGWQPQPGQQPPPQWGQQPVARQAGFFSKLFDFSFSSFVTPSIIKVIYQIVLGLIVLGWLGYSILAFTRSIGLGLFVLVIVGPLIGLLYVIIARITLELYLAVFRIAEDVREIKDSRRS